LGSGPGATLIGIDHPSNNTLVTSSNTPVPHQFIDNLTFGAVQSNSGAVLTVGDGSKLLVRNCCIGSPNNLLSAGTRLVRVLANAAFTTRTLFEDCVFTPGGAAAQAFTMDGFAFATEFNRCKFVAPASYTPTNGGMVYGDIMTFRRCSFYNANAAAGTYANIKFSDTAVAGRVEGCDFYAGAGATITCIALGTYAAGSGFWENNNQFSAGLTAYSYVSAAANAASVIVLGSRTTRVYEATSNVTPLTLPVSQYGAIILHRTTNADQALVGDGLPPNGAPFSLTIENRSGGNITTETILGTGAAQVAPGQAPTINAGQTSVLFGIVEATLFAGGPVIKLLAAPVVI
jgi:hypothetical protein